MGTSFADLLSSAGEAAAATFETAAAFTYDGNTYAATAFPVDRELKKTTEGVLYHSNIASLRIRESVLSRSSINTKLPITYDGQRWQITHVSNAIGGQYELTIEADIPREIGRNGYRGR